MVLSGRSSQIGKDSKIITYTNLQMIGSLSILIPCCNCDCTTLVNELARQCSVIQSFRYEIIIADDGSTDTTLIITNRALEAVPNVYYKALPKSRNRSAMRNRLASLASYEWQLQINANVRITRMSFILDYISVTSAAKVVCGSTSALLDKTNLRAKYEYAFHQKNNINNAATYFRNTNCLYHDSVFRIAKYDESIDGYGYEDLVFGNELRRQDIEILCIDNPVEYSSLESNASYLAKTEEALRTLKSLEPQLSTSSLLIKTANRLSRFHLSPIIRFWHTCLSGIERRNLCGSHPSLRIFALYKLGYYLTL